MSANSEDTPVPHIVQAREALNEASKSAGRYAGYIGLTAVSVAFSVVVLVTVAQQAVVWAHQVALAERHTLSPALSERVGHRSIDVVPQQVPAYGAGLNALVPNMAKNEARDG